MVELIEILEAFRPGPGEELLLEDPLELRDGVWLKAAAAGVLHIGFDGLLDGNPRLFSDRPRFSPVGECGAQAGGCNSAGAFVLGCAGAGRAASGDGEAVGIGAAVESGSGPNGGRPLLRASSSLSRYSSASSHIRVEALARKYSLSTCPPTPLGQLQRRQRRSRLNLQVEE